MVNYRQEKLNGNADGLSMRMGYQGRRMCRRKTVDTPMTGVILVQGGMGTKAPLKERSKERERKEKRKNVLDT